MLHTTIDQLRASARARLKTRAIAGPQSLGGQLLIREMSGADQLRFVSSYSDGETPEEQRGNQQKTLLEVAARCIIDPEGKRYLDSEEGREFLADLDPLDLCEITNEIFDLSGLTPEEDEASKKNSETHTTDSPSSSP